MTRHYDLIFFLSDGSIPTSLARYNILHFQVPFPTLKASRLKRIRFQAVVCNSQFTKDHIDPKFEHKALVIYPPVNTRDYTERKKEKIILSVGRFTSVFQAKKQEILIDVFNSIRRDRRLSGWRLVLAGGLLESDNSYFKKLEEMCVQASTTLHPNISHGKLRELYESASIFWHAAGYGETNPMHMEHFGISTVEAMAAGCIPIVYNGGGLSEIVRHGVSGFLWENTREIEDITLSLIDNTAIHKALRQKVRERADVFDRKKFYDAFDRLLKNITS